jgi:hypothetical protein
MDRVHFQCDGEQPGEREAISRAWRCEAGIDKWRKRTRFSPDGKKIYFLSNNKLMAADFHADRSVREPSVLFEPGDRIVVSSSLSVIAFLMVLRNDIDSPPIRIIANWQPPLTPRRTASTQSRPQS